MTDNVVMIRESAALPADPRVEQILARAENAVAHSEQTIKQMASLVILLEGRLRETEAALHQKVTVSGKEAQSLTRAVQSRARAKITATTSVLPS